MADAGGALAFAAAGATLGPAGRFESLELPGVEVVLLAQLARALPGAGDEMPELPRPVGTPAASGPWVLALPSSFVADLAALDDADVAGVAERWAAAPEWSPRDPAPAVLETSVRALAGLARQALRSGAGLYLWWSL